MADQESVQNINLNVSGAERLAEATALLQDFQGVIQSVLSNPIYSSAVWNRAAHTLENAFVTPLRKSVQLSKDQQIEFDKLVGKSRGLITITGFVSGLAAALAKTTLETQRASAELGRFMNFDRLPGGANNLFQAQNYMRRMEAANTIGFNEQFAKQTTQTYLTLQRRLSALIPDDNTVRKLVERLSVLQTGLGVNAPAFVTEFADRYRSFGMDEVVASKLFSTLMGEVQRGNTMKFLSPQDAAQTLMQGIFSSTAAGTNPMTAANQSLNVMQTYGNRLGADQMAQLFNVLPRFLNELRENVTLRGTVGVKEGDLTGDKALINMANAFAKEVQRVSKGQPIDSIMDYINKGGLYSKTILEKLGITNEMLQLFNTLPQNVQAITEMADTFKNIKLDPNVLASSYRLGQTLKDIEDSLRNSSDLLEWMGAHWTKFSTTLTESAKELGIDPKWLQAAALGLSVGGLVKFGPMMLRSFLKTAGIPLTTVESVANTGVRFTPLVTEAGTPITTASRFSRIAGGVARVSPYIAGAGYLTELAMQSEEFRKGRERGLTDEQIQKMQSITRGEGMLSPRRVLGFFGVGEEDLSAIFGPSRKEEQLKFLKELRKGKMTATDFGEQYEYLKDIFGEKGVEFLKENTYLKDRIPKMQYLPGTPEYIKQQNEMYLQSITTPPDTTSQAIIDAMIQGIEKPKEEEDTAGKDIGNLRIIIENGNGDLLANQTLSEAQAQGAIRIIMGGVSEA